MINSFSGQYRFLSNFYPSPINYMGYPFATVEHAFQAMKATSYDQFSFVQRATTPAMAKKRAHAAPCRWDWEFVKVGIMRDCLKLKFADRDFLQKLLATRPHELIEGNHWNDTFWGVCLGVGQNNLGKLLMEIRDAN